jgi:hypothetical protein
MMGCVERIIGLSNEMGYQAHWMLLADDAERLL